MLNLGGITFGVGIDTRTLSQGQGAIEAFGKRVDAVMSNSKGKIDATTNAFINQERIMVKSLQSVQNQIDRINNMTIAPKLKNDFVQKLNSAQLALTNGMVGGANDKLTNQRLTLGFKEQVDAINRQAAAAQRAVRPNQDFAGGLRALAQSSALTLGPLNGITYRLGASASIMRQYGLAIGITAAAIGGLTLTLATLGNQLVSNVILYQKSEMTLKGITNSAAVADAELIILRESANQAGLSFTALAPSFSRFVSSAVGAGQSLQTTNEEFKQFAMVAGTLHLSTDEVNGTLRAFDQMLSMGRVQGQEMRQLFNQLPAVFEIASKAAKNMGVDLRDSMKKGQLAAGPFIEQFLKVATTMFNIDMGKPINSLQASLTRVQSSWQGFVLNFDQALQASKAFQGVIDGVVGGINALGANITQVIGVMGALAGAIAGVVAGLAALAVIQVVTAGITMINTAFAAMTAASAAAAGGLRMTTIAMIGLDAVMVANPIGAVVTALGLLVAAVTGAKIGYDAFTKAVDENRAAFADTSSIEAYIVRQQELGKNISSVTLAMVNQIKVMEAANQANISRAMTTVGNAERLQKGTVGGLFGGEKTLSYVGNVITGKGFSEKNHQADAVDKVTDAYKDLDAQMKESARLHGVLTGLSKLSLLPEDRATANFNPNNKTPQGKDPERGLRSFDALIEKGGSAQKMLDNMWKGPADQGLITALDDIQTKLFNLDPDQLTALDKLLASEDAVKGIKDRAAQLLVLRERVDIAKQTVQDFNKVWDDIQQGRIELAGINKQLEFLQRGGNPDNFWLIEASTKASEALRKLTQGDLKTLQTTLDALEVPKDAADAIMSFAGTSKAAAMQAVVKVLGDYGYGISQTGDAAIDAQADLANFYATISGGQQALSTAADAIVELQHPLANMGSYLMQAQVRFENLNALATTGSKEAKEAVEAVNTALEAQGYKTGTLAERWAAFQQNLAVQQAKLQDWTQFTSNALDSFGNVLSGAQKMGDAIRSIFQDLKNTIVQAFIIEPLKAKAIEFIKTKILGQTAQVSQQVVLATNTATVGINTAATIANTAAIIALTGVTAVHSATNAAKTGGKILKTAASFADAFGRATGGPMMAGQAYRVEEAGTGNELFVPGASGMMYKQSQLMGAGKTAIIDAKTTLILQGNTTDAQIDRIMQELDARDNRLRQELPGMIDTQVVTSTQRGKY